MRNPLRAAVVAAALVFAATGAAFAQVLQERIDLDAIQRIRQEGFERSQIEPLMRHLTDVIGPRLSYSPAHRRADEWAAGKLREWGLVDVAHEPIDAIGRAWEPLSYSGRIIAPYVQALHAEPTAWTGSTKGRIEGDVTLLDVESPDELEAYRGKLEGAIVMLGRPGSFPLRPLPPARADADSILAQPRAAAGAPSPEQRRQQYEQAMQRWREERARAEAVADFIAGENVAAVLRPSERAYGNIRVGGSRAGRDPGRPVPPPELIVAHEQYAQMYRNIKAGVPVRVELDVRNRFPRTDGRTYNTVGRIPGSDLADEFVVIGAHIDSWHAGTGATDNAAGVVVMMEAVRILRTLGLQPRRSIIIGLWTGEELGYLGSRAWLERHRDLHPRISAYLNLDNGAGRIRGIYSQENAAAAPILEQLLASFPDLGVVDVRHARTGGTDHEAFDAEGIPGFQFIQDPLDYMTHTHHTFSDRFERIIPDDLKQAAVIVASMAYHLANRDEPLPRKPAA